MNLTVDIISAEKSLLENAEAESVTAPGAEGEFQVLPGHTTLLAVLSSGRITVEGAGGPRSFDVNGGFAEVMGDHVRILAD